jgi:PAP2 superfamily
VLSFPRGLSILAVLGGLVTLVLAQDALAQDIPQSDHQDTTASDESRTADWRTLVPNVLDDQRRMFGTFPAELAHGKHWLPLLAVAAATTGLVITDQYDAGYFRRTTSLNRFNSAFSSGNTAAGTVLAPVALYSAGYFFKDDYAKETALLSGEAALDGEIVDTVMKVVSDRLRPAAIPVSGNFADSFVEGKSRLNGSFPSGHTVAAFSVATIISRRYGRRHKWVPVVAYGLSAAVGFSRVSLSAHFASDVFFGAAVGYGIGRFAVLHE